VYIVHCTIRKINIRFFLLVVIFWELLLLERIAMMVTLCGASWLSNCFNFNCNCNFLFCQFIFFLNFSVCLFSSTFFGDFYVILVIFLGFLSSFLIFRISTSSVLLSW